MMILTFDDNDEDDDKMLMMWMLMIMLMVAKKDIHNHQSKVARQFKTHYIKYKIRTS